MVSSVSIVTAYFIVWALIHSLLASMPAKRWARRALGQVAVRGYRLVFNTVAAITVSPLFALLVLLPDRTLYVVPSPWRWTMVGGQVLAVIALVWTSLQTGPLRFLGLAQLFVKQPDQSGPLQVRGMYRYVRHPLYLLSLLLIWLTPAMTANLLTLYVLIALYFHVGSLHEERRLLAEFGDAYRDYQRQVPRLIPCPRRRSFESKDGPAY